MTPAEAANPAAQMDQLAVMYALDGPYINLPHADGRHEATLIRRRDDYIALSGRGSKAARSKGRLVRWLRRQGYDVSAA